LVYALYTAFFTCADEAPRIELDQRHYELLWTLGKNEMFLRVPYYSKVLKWLSEHQAFTFSFGLGAKNL
jgi:hypothetical protein